MTRYAVEVQTIGDSGWTGNAMTYATMAEAEIAAIDLMSRWLRVTEYRIVPVIEDSQPKEAL